MQMTDVSFPVIKIRNSYDIKRVINLLRRGTGVGYELVTAEFSKEYLERRFFEALNLNRPRTPVRALWTSPKKS